MEREAKKEYYIMYYFMLLFQNQANQVILSIW
jgi:hypothetical protein